MGRPRKNDSDALVNVVNDYFSNIAMGDARKLKYSNLAKHAENLGIHAAWYDFQRDNAVLQRIAELRAIERNDDELLAVPAYKNLDIEEFLNHCGTAEELKKKLYELDQYWKKTYDEAIKTMEEDRKLFEKLQTLENNKADILRKQNEYEQRIKALEHENVFLRKMIRDNLYPAIANELLKEANLPVPENEAVKPEAISSFIEDGIPQPLVTKQPSQTKKLSRQEQLIADLHKQVKKHGEQ